MRTIVIVAVIMLALSSVNAAISVKLDKPKTTGNKTVLKLTLKNTFTEKIEGARATIFLIGEQGKVVGQRTAWIIGGEPNKPALKPDATTTYNFVIDTEKPVTSARVVLTRVLLEGGKLADPQKDVSME
jgi:hypothetical protein